MVTLIPSDGATCKGIAYLVEHHVFEHLDHREKNGYRRIATEILLTERGESVTGALYVADDNNFAFLGPAPIEQIAGHIARSCGPSGSNRDYLTQLASALDALGDDDDHVRALTALLNDR